MRKNLPLLFILFTLVISLYAPRSPAQIQPAMNQDFQPPQLLTPENGSTVKGAPEFFWTSAVLPKGFKGSYILKVVPISQGQTPVAALAGNTPLHQAKMRRTGEAYPADGPALKNGQTYAWGVQVVDANGAPVGGDQGLSDAFVFVFGADETPPPAQGLNITTQPLVMTGMRVGSLTIDTQPLVMTGIRPESITLTTQALVMTGMRIQSITVNTQPLVMTGMRTESITLTTQPLVMTGMRVESITINTDALKMTGMREEKADQPDEGRKTRIKKPGEMDLDKKLDLPLKKTPKVVEAKDPGQINGKTDENKLPGETPDLEPVQQSLPIGKAEPLDNTVSTPLKKKLEGLQDANVPKGIETPVGTDAPISTPAGTETSAPGQKLKDVQESLKGKTPAGEKPANVKTGTEAGQK
jgi:hypothetical protein